MYDRSNIRLPADASEADRRRLHRRAVTYSDSPTVSEMLRATPTHMDRVASARSGTWLQARMKATVPAWAAFARLHAPITRRTPGCRRMQNRLRLVSYYSPSRKKSVCVGRRAHYPIREHNYVGFTRSRVGHGAGRSLASRRYPITFATSSVRLRELVFSSKRLT